MVRSTSAARPSEVGVERQRARQDFGPEKRSRTMADHHDFLGVAGARDLDEILREAIDARVPFRPLPVREFPGPDRVGQQIEQIGRVFGVFQHRAEHGDEQRRRGGHGEQVGNAEGLQPPGEAEGDAERRPAPPGTAGNAGR